MEEPSEQYKQIAEYQQAFAAFDHAAPGFDGRITATKIKLVLENSLGEVASNQEVQDMIKAVDDTGTGNLTFPAFLNMMEKTSQDLEAEEDFESRALDLATIREVFDFFDKDKDGFINLDELAQVFTSQQEHVTKEQLAIMSQALSGDISGLISFNSFKLMMLK